MTEYEWVDYPVLLKKYAEYVLGCEGCHFLDPREGLATDTDVEFSDTELEILKKVASSI